MTTELLAAYSLFILALISPGPDFVITIQNSVKEGSLAGYFTALGVSIANGLHILYVSIGVGSFITGSVIATLFLKYFSILYLLYLAITCLRSKAQNLSEIETIITGDINSTKLNPKKAFKTGFLVNAFNPKAVFFWLSYFAYISTLNLNKSIYISFVIILVLSTFIWFSTVSFVMTRKHIRSAFLSREKQFNIVMGIILLLLSIKLIFS